MILCLKESRVDYRMALTLFLSNAPIIPFDDKATVVYGDVRAKLESRGTPIDPTPSEFSPQIVNKT